MRTCSAFSVFLPALLGAIIGLGFLLPLPAQAEAPPSIQPAPTLAEQPEDHEDGAEEMAEDPLDHEAHEDHDGHDHEGETRDFGEDYALTFVEPYDALLLDYVKKGTKGGMSLTLVDYASWAEDKRHHIALGMLEAANLQTLTTKEEVLAFWINAYNLLTIDLIVKTGEKKSIKNQGKLLISPWKAHTWPVAGKDVTLDEIEHKVLRRLEEPRIHFAINCASLSCPDLLDEVYRPHQLDKQLTAQTKAFLTNPAKGLRLEGSTLHLSALFDWFAEDFGPLTPFLKAYAPAPTPHTQVKFMDYNWNLNGNW